MSFTVWRGQRSVYQTVTDRRDNLKAEPRPQHLRLRRRSSTAELQLNAPQLDATILTHKLDQA
jgi:hypothetical protein